MILKSRPFGEGVGKAIGATLTLCLCFGCASIQERAPAHDQLEVVLEGDGRRLDAKETKEPAPGGDLPLHPGCVELYRSTDTSCTGFAYDWGDLCVDCETHDTVAPGVPTNCIREYLPTTTCNPGPTPYSKVHDCRDILPGGECVYTGDLCKVGWAGIPGKKSALCVAF